LLIEESKGGAELLQTAASGQGEGPVMRIAVLTPSLPDRGEMLGEAIASVRAQSLRPSVHAIGIDYADVGIGAMLNRLANSTDADWFARLDDDDLLKPNHLELLSSRAEEADVIYTWCDVQPRATEDGAPEPPSVLGPTGWIPNQEFDEDRLRSRNYIPATTLIRRSLWREVGGWLEDGMRLADGRRDAELAEDWDFWLRALDAHARFVCIPEITWTYRYHGANLWLR
jgi:hypothetical protein